MVEQRGEGKEVQDSGLCVAVALGCPPHDSPSMQPELSTAGLKPVCFTSLGLSRLLLKVVNLIVLEWE